jgi:hypothetical protein
MKNLRRIDMGQYNEAVQERKFQIFKERTNLPTIEGRAEWDYILLHYPDGKKVKSFTDKRKKDEVIEEAWR